jgi:16S rRNA (adenine1518-N6/adenine1519-N6)-dimethyltransferase
MLEVLEGRARKRFGQHFLASTGIVRRIIGLAEIEDGTRVVEVGPGLGVLTEHLVAAGGRVVAIELDRDLANHIQGRFPEVTLHQLDGASIDWSTFLEGSQWRCVANLPYNVGTRIVTRMLACPDRFSRLVVMLQREVAERMVAPAGRRNRGALSVYVEARAQARIALRVPPGAFHPPPRVHSAVVVLDVHEPRISGVPVEHFDRVVRTSFSAPRKTIRNTLSSGWERERVDEALNRAEVESRRRPGTLSVEEFVRLARVLEETDPCA